MKTNWTSVILISALFMCGIGFILILITSLLIAYINKRYDEILLIMSGIIGAHFLTFFGIIVKFTMKYLKTELQNANQEKEKNIKEKEASIKEWIKLKTTDTKKGTDE